MPRSPMAVPSQVACPPTKVGSLSPTLAQLSTCMALAPSLRSSPCSPNSHVDRQPTQTHQTNGQASCTADKLFARRTSLASLRSTMPRPILDVSFVTQPQQPFFSSFLLHSHKFTFQRSTCQIFPFTSLIYNIQIFTISYYIFNVCHFSHFVV